MDLLWPGFLLLLGLIPLTVVIYIWVLRRRRRFAVRYSSLSLVREALSHQSRLRRHLPFALFLVALASLVGALTRPVAIVSVPADQTAIILTIDVSRSMLATDIEPSRMDAAQAAAMSFVERQNSNVQIGIVAFAGYAELVQPPTSDQRALKAAIQSLTTARRTAIGSGILKSLDAIAAIDSRVAPSVPVTGAGTGLEPTPVPRGAYAPDIVVLLTDGVSNSGPMPLDAAQQAVDRGVKVYTIGFGTENGSIPFDNRDPFGGSTGGGFRTGIDEETLKRIADMTGGKYYEAMSASELEDVFRNLPTYLITKHETTEISFAFAAAGALLAGLATVLSLLWHPLP